MPVSVGFQAFVPHRHVSRGKHSQLRNPARFYTANRQWLVVVCQIKMKKQFAGVPIIGIFAKQLITYNYGKEYINFNR